MFVKSLLHECPLLNSVWESRKFMSQSSPRRVCNLVKKMTYKHIKGQITIKDIFQGNARNDGDRRQFMISYANQLCSKQLPGISRMRYTLPDLLTALERTTFFSVFHDSIHTWFPSNGSNCSFSGSFASWFFSLNTQVIRAQSVALFSLLSTVFTRFRIYLLSCQSDSF